MNQTPDTLQSLSTGLRATAEGGEFRSIDLDAVHRLGDRRRRHRRAGVAALAVAAVAAVSIGVPALSGSDAPRGVDPAGAPGVAPDRLAAWAMDRDLHTPDGVVRMASPVHAFVATDTGYVVLDDAGTVSQVRGDDVTTLADAVPTDSSARLVTDGRYVAWSTHDEDQLFLTINDQLRDRTVVQIAADLDPRFDPAEGGGVLGLDAGRLYYAEARGVVTVDLTDPEQAETVLVGPLPEDTDVLDVRAGQTLLAERDGLSLGPLGDHNPPVPGTQFASYGTLSPTAAYVAPDGETLSVRRPDGTDVTPTLPSGYESFATAYGWVDADTVAVLAAVGNSDRPTSGSLLTCEVPSGDCTVVVPEVGPFEDGFQLPVGTTLD